MSAVDTGSSRVRVDRRMYLTEDRDRAVPDGDPEARFLLCVPGGEMLRADAVRYGVLKSTPEREPEPEQKKAPRAANKARGRAAIKGA